MRRSRSLQFLAWALVLALFLSACAREKPLETVRSTRTTVLTPEAPGEIVTGNDYATLDSSRTQEGYIQVRYSGEAPRAKLQLMDPEGTLYIYTLLPGGFETLPLTGGDGIYSVTVLENAFDNVYAVAYTGELEASQVDEFKPYLYPNQYVWYTEDSKVYALGAELSAKSRDDLHYVENVYAYVVENVEYDYDLAASIPVDYLPDVDRTLETGKGVCLDYAALMTALLRSQGIPAKLVVGWSGTQYHAWISVYLAETGWVDGVIFFDGINWSRFDPTLAAGNRGTSVKDYVNNNSNYREKLFY